MLNRATPLIFVAFALGAIAGALARGPSPSESAIATPAAAAQWASPLREQPRDLSPRTPLIGAYQARVLRVIDGDTVEARVHVWMGQEVVTRVRLNGIDAPELTGACATERELAERARLRLAALAGGRDVTLVDIRPDKYFGRVAGRLLMADGGDAGNRLVAEGLARTGTRRFNWC